MRYTLFLTAFCLCATPIVMAESAQACSQQAIESANGQYLRDLSSHISEFANRKNNAAVTELSRIKPKESFRKKHAKEIKQFGNPDFQPSQAFCDDAYANLQELNQQIDKVVKKYGD